MKIIRLSTFLDYGGIESKMVNLSRYEDTQNDWIFCAIGKGGVAASSIRNNGKSTLCLNLTHRIPSWRTIRCLYQLFKSEQPDVVHTSGAEANFHGLIAARLAGINRIVAEEIGIPGQSKTAKIIFKVIYRLADLVVAESSIVAEKLKALYGIDRRKLKVVPNFCIAGPAAAGKAAEAVDLIEKSGAFKLVSVSRLEPVKNLEAVLRVVARLRKESYDVSYTIVGDGSLLQTLKDLSQQYALEEQVVFAGYQNNPEAYLLSADLFVLNSLSEGFSNALLEAMLLGLPCLSTNVGAAPEIITDGQQGWIVAVDEEALYQKIKMIMGLKPGQRKEVGVNGSHKVMANYTLDQHVHMLMQIYQS